MPKIPTFEAQTRPTAEVSGIKTSFQAPVETAGSMFGSAAKVATSLDEYYVREQALKDKTESTKAYLELTNDIDTIEQGAIKNIDPSQAESTFQKQFNFLAKQKIDSMQNKAAARLLEDKLSLDLITRSSKVVKGSRDQLVLEYNNTWNTENQIDQSQYSLATTPEEKDILKNKLKANVMSRNFYNNDGQVKLKEDLKKLNSSLLFLDSGQLVGLENGKDAIKNLDSSLKDQTLLTDEDFGKGLYEVYNQKISSLTVKGNPDSDYDRALDLAKELESFERYNGYKVKTGELSTKINSLREKIEVERIQHENLIRQLGDNKLFFEYSDDQIKALTEDIASTSIYSQPTLEDRQSSLEIKTEYDQMIRDYLKYNKDATLEQRKDFSRDLIYNLKTIYEDRASQKVQPTRIDKNRFDVETEYQNVLNDMKLYSENALDSEKITQYKNLAKLRGYKITTTTKDSKGKQIKTVEGDINSFVNDYLPALAEQVRLTTKQK
jgi:hypothetical protein